MLIKYPFISHHCVVVAFYYCFGIHPTEIGWHSIETYCMSDQLSREHSLGFSTLVSVGVTKGWVVLDQN